MKKIISMLLAVMLMVGAFAGCGAKSEEKKEESSNGGSEASVRDDLIVGIVSEGTSMDPHKGGAGNRAMFDNMYLGLVRLDENTEIVPAIAESWELAEDEMSYIFNLDKDMKFSNGDDITAQDVLFSLERTRADDSNAYRYEAMDSFEVIDEDTFKINLAYKSALVLPVLTASCSTIVNQARIEELGADLDLDCSGTMAGPYEFDSWESGVSITLKANEYWPEELAIKTVEFRFISEASTGVISVESGDIDAYMDPNYVDVQYIKNEDVAVYSQLKNGFDFLGFSTIKPPFDDARVRQAIAYGYDAEELIAAAIGTGGAEIANSFLPSFVFGADTDPSPYSYNPEKAKELLAEAGYPDGIELHIETMSSDYLGAAEYLQETLKASNITVIIDQVEYSKFVADLMSGSLEAFIIGVTEDYPDADFTLYGQFKSDGGQNVHAYVNEEVDELLIAARQCNNVEEREQMYIDIQKIMMEDLPAIPIYFSKAFAIYDADIAGFRTNYSAMLQVEYASWTK